MNTDISCFFMRRVIGSPSVLKWTLQLFIPALLIMMATNCAWLVPAPVGDPSAESLVARWRRQNDSLQQMKGLLSVRVTSDNETFSGRAAWAAEIPAKMRVEWLNPIGQPLYSMSADGNTISVRQAGDLKIRHIKQRGTTLDRVIHMPVSVQDLIDILWGRPPLPGYVAAQYEQGGTRVVLKNRWGERVADLLVGSDDRVHNVDVYSRDGNLKYAIVWQSWQTIDNKTFPARIVLNSGSGDRISMTINRLWTKVDLPPETFILETRQD